MRGTPINTALRVCLAFRPLRRPPAAIRTAPATITREATSRRAPAERRDPRGGRGRGRCRPALAAMAARGEKATRAVGRRHVCNASALRPSAKRRRATMAACSEPGGARRDNARGRDAPCSHRNAEIHAVDEAARRGSAPARSPRPQRRGARRRWASASNRTAAGSVARRGPPSCTRRRGRRWPSRACRSPLARRRQLGRARDACRGSPSCVPLCGHGVAAPGDDGRPWRTATPNRDGPRAPDAFGPATPRRRGRQWRTGRRRPAKMRNRAWWSNFLPPTGPPAG